MLKLSRKDKKNLIKTYKAFYEKVMREAGSSLTLEEKKAVGQNVVDELYEKACINLNIPENDRPVLKREIEELIKREFGELLSDTPLEFTEQRGFRKKKT